MIFRLYARNCCFQGVVLNLKFTLINSLSSMFDQLPYKWVIHFFFFNSYRNSRVLAVRNIDLHSARILFYFSIFFYFFCNKQFTNYSKWLIRYSIYIYIYLSRYNTRRCIGNTSRQLIPPITDAYFSLDCYPTPSELKRILCLLQNNGNNTKRG